MEPLHERTDETLLSDYRTGDRAALRELISRYRDDLMRFLVRFLGNRAAAEDVFQEAFLQVHLSAESFDAGRRFRPWLFTIAANKARDHHRKHARRQPVSLSAALSRDGEGSRFVDLMEAEIPAPGDRTEAAETAERVRRVVEGMPPHLREILLLSYFQRMSYGQIAETLKIPLGTVKSRLHAAVAGFARAWQAAEPTAEPTGAEEDDR